MGDIAKALGAKQHGRTSEYATFETRNDRIVTIRLANHNAKVSTFDNKGENEGISIVISAKGNLGIANDGYVHIVEYYYDAIKLRRAEGKPLVDIISFHIVTDKKEIDRLNSEPTMKVYRGMQFVDGKLYHPMSAKVNGEWREVIDVKDLGKGWEQADENPELADDKGNFKLDKGNKSSLKARLNGRQASFSRSSREQGP